MDSVGSPNLDSNPPPRTRRRRGAPALRLTLPGLLLLLLLNGAACAGIAWLFFLYQKTPKQAIVTSIVTVTQTSTFTPEPTWTETPTQTPTFTSSPTSTPTETEAPFVDPALTTPLILSLQDQAYKHLFAYQPLAFASDPGLPLTRLTSGDWDDINPAISPDGSQIAFVSNRSGYWDIYLYRLQSGVVERVTDTFDYDNHPSWSPDGQWLVFETYQEGSLEIVIRSALDTSSPAIRLTNNSSADYQPAWSPQGREVAFVSDRSGSPQIYLVDLNQVDESLVKQLTTGQQLQLSHPAWSPDGARLAWAEVRSGEHNLVVLNLRQTDAHPVLIGSGDLPVWGPGANAIFTLLKSPNSDSLMMYYLDRPGVMSPPIPLGLQAQGMDWRQSLSIRLPLAPMLGQVAAVTPPPVYQPALLAGTPVPGGRQILNEIDKLQAPYPLLQDRVDESFNALRSRLTKQLGWDFLGTLENAYIPLTAPLPPGAGNSWLYTGRAFAVNSQWINAGWMVVIREDFGTETYWRIYLKPVYQDGSAGEPLKDRPWDFLSRFDGDLKAYEQGGQYLDEIPSGYWFDFTAFAQQYNWQRLPALPTWLSAYPQARFNEFVLTDGMDWRQAMLEIYPPEIFITPSPVLPPTETPRPTSRWYVSPTPTLTLTPRPTFTPPPSITATASSTPTATQTPRPSATPTPSKTTAKTATATSSSTSSATVSPTVTLTPTR